LMDASLREGGVASRAWMYVSTTTLLEYRLISGG